ncbi:MAG: hypothetical protein WC748_09840 [Legionellales bacterium]|jgi:hypothetical protein
MKLTDEEQQNLRLNTRKLELSAKKDLPVILEAILDLQSIAIKKHDLGYTIITMEPEVEYLSKGETLTSALSAALNKLNGGK